MGDNLGILTAAWQVQHCQVTPNMGPIKPEFIQICIFFAPNQMLLNELGIISPLAKFYMNVSQFLSDAREMETLLFLDVNKRKRFKRMTTAL